MIVSYSPPIFRKTRLAYSAASSVKIPLRRNPHKMVLQIVDRMLASSKSTRTLLVPRFSTFGKLNLASAAKCVGESGEGVRTTGKGYTIILRDVYVHNSGDSTAHEHHRA